MTKPFDARKFPYPITDVIPAVREKLHTDNTLIISAPPGAGKSTVLPLALIDEDWLEGQRIIMLEPRRLAARSVPMRMSDMLEEKCGANVG